MALAHKRGLLPHASKEVKDLADSLDEETISHFADTPTDKLPERVKAAFLGAARNLFGDAAGIGAAGGESAFSAAVNNTNAGASMLDAAQPGAKLVGKPLVAEAGEAAAAAGKGAPLLNQAGLAGKAVGGVVKYAPVVAGAALLNEGREVLQDPHKAQEETGEKLEHQGVMGRALYGATAPLHMENAYLGAINEAGHENQNLQDSTFKGDQQFQQTQRMQNHGLEVAKQHGYQDMDSFNAARRGGKLPDLEGKALSDISTPGSPAVPVQHAAPAPALEAPAPPKPTAVISPPQASPGNPAMAANPQKPTAEISAPQVSPGNPAMAANAHKPTAEITPPPTVSTPQAMDKPGSLLKLAEEILVGGPGDNKPDAAFKPRDLKKGTKEELEHTNNPSIAKEIAKDHLVENPQEYVKEGAQRHCNLLARRNDRPEAEAAIDRFLESLALTRDDAGEIKAKAMKPRTYECPQCKGSNAKKRTAHEETSMECQEMSCPDCGFFCEDTDDLDEKQTHPAAEGGEAGEHEGEGHKSAAASGVPLTGPEAIAHALGKLDLGKVDAEARAVITGKKVSKRPRAVQILNVLEGLKRNNITPSDLMINSVPVIPPAFRPFSVVGDTFVPGDANELYRDLMHLRDGYHEARGVLGDAGTGDTRLELYDAIKALYGYGEPTSPKTKQRGVAGFLKAVSGSSPKWSFFQRKLISKPMDSVSRGTITVDPDLSLNEIGVPEDMAWTMYKPYIQRRLTVSLGMSPTDALTHVTDRTDHAHRALLKEMEVRPVIYTRAPSWHKFNVLAGRPKLIKGNTIAINPLVTTGQNADFDGDAMNLHVPSHPDAVQEAYDKLLPSKMLWSIRDQDKVMPTLKHEQILGLFTAVHKPAKNKFKFASEDQAVDAIRSGQVSLSDEVELPPPI